MQTGQIIYVIQSRLVSECMYCCCMYTPRVMCEGSARAPGAGLVQQMDKN